MFIKPALAAATALALVGGIAHAQTEAAPAESAAPAPAAEAAPAPAPAAPAYTPISARGDIVDTLKASPQFTTLTKALEATNLSALLKAHKGLTIFAPTDAAFAALPAGELDRLMKSDNAGELQGVLAYHLVNASVGSDKIEGAKGPVTTVARAELLLDGSDETLKANSAPILQSDVRTTSGIIHVVGEVLSPSDPAIAQARAEAAAAEAAAAQANEGPAG